MRSFISYSSLAAGLFLALANAAPYNPVLQRQNAGDRLVFAHFMMGIVPNRKAATDYDMDMKLAKEAGIDAFALNIGTDTYTEQQLNYAYDSAAKHGMKLFISFDFHWFSPTGAAADVGKLIKAFGSKPAQLRVDNKVFVSSFVGDGLNVAAVRAAAGVDIYFAPNFSPEATPNPASIDGALNWIAWDSDGRNKAPKPGQNLTVAQGDAKYTKWLGNKGYIASVSPWFFTHYGPEVSYSKNWVFPGDLLWYNRWNEIIKLDQKPRFIEILTWNDFGESHYIGPLASKHTDDGNSKWVNDMPHSGWLEMAKPFIAAYKANSKTPASYIKEDKLVYWYRPTLKSANCDATDTTMADVPNPGENYFKGRPNGYETMSDAVFVVALLKEGGKVTVGSGKNTKTFEAPAGASAWQVEMGVGKQTFVLQRGGKQILGETSLRDVTDTCPCGLYNYNAFVGVAPAGPKDNLDAEGLAGLTKGLKVKCEAKPSLPIGGGPAPVGPTAAPPASNIPASSSPSPKPSSAAPAPVSSKAPVPSSGTPSATPVATSAQKSSTPVPSSATPVPVPATSTKQSGAGGCTKTVTASAQIFPTNCLGSGQVWAVSTGETPDCCDGAAPCCK
ncbi:alpha-1,3-glucanase/mutanase [Dendryphion nanum]|uniref:Alpha-1,3-glucanase/mutanase n=1 Tax=Dendryphion nanum TaxID=256645 RepID=A0A9P9IPH8_9PLEO|nr:alpha-1,3-glucanase/mutanase [Dendryphion nanum]